MHPIEAIKKLMNITPEQEEAVMTLMHDTKMAKGETIEGAATISTSAFYLEKGAARIYYTDHGREHTVSFAFDDTFLVLPQLIRRQYMDTLAIQFLEPSRLISFRHADVKTELERTRSEVSLESMLIINTALANYVGYLEERVLVMQSLSARERYEWALQRFPRLTDCATTTQIASFLGLTKETLYRIKNGNYRKTK